MRREVGREREKECEQRNTIRAGPRSAGPMCEDVGRYRLQGIDAGRHGVMCFLYDRRMIRGSVDTGRNA
jgi:hypothetical protein